MDGTNLLAHTVLCLPNGEGEAGVQDAAVGKHLSSVNVLLTSQAAAASVVTFSTRHRRSLAVSSPACGICDRAVKPQNSCSYQADAEPS